MRLEVAEASDADTWDARVSSLGGTLFHSDSWARYKCHGGRGRPLFFSWFDDHGADPSAVALGIQHPPPRSTNAILGTRLTFDSSPAGLAQADFVESLEEWCSQSSSIVEVNLGSFDARTQWSTRPLDQPVDRLEFHLPPREEDEVLRHMRKGARWSIKKAMKSGVDVQQAHDPPTLRAFAGLYRSTLDRLTRTKSVPHQPLDLDRFAEALGLLTEGGRGRLYLASLNGRYVAGCFFGLFEDAAFYLFNGTTDDGLEVGATPLLLLTAARDFSAAGCVRINLGGVAADASDPRSDEHGLYSFKLGLGATPVRCTGGRLRVRPLRAELVELAARLARGYASMRG